MKRLDVVCRQRCHIEPCSPANSRDRLRCAIVDSSRLPGFLTDMMTNMARQNAHGNPTAERQMVPTWNGPIASFSHPLKRGCSSTLFDDLKNGLHPASSASLWTHKCKLLVARGSHVFTMSFESHSALDQNAFQRIYPTCPNDAFRSKFTIVLIETRHRTYKSTSRTTSAHTLFLA